jgi:hypothetical protein
VLSRRDFVASAAAVAATSITGFESARGNDLPAPLVNAHTQLYDFIKLLANEQGIAGGQKLILNSTIVPLDISPDTPYYNEELFRQYADRAFHGGKESLTAGGPASRADRFSYQYSALLDVAASQIDQNHPEIANSLKELKSELKQASEDLTSKITQLEGEWSKIATARALDKTSNDYELQRLAWMAQVKYGDQLQTYSSAIDSVNARINKLRSDNYKDFELGVSKNLSFLSTAYNLTRPWSAQTEKWYKTSPTPLSPETLADPTKLVPALFDSSPAVMPIGDLVEFLSGSGLRTFDTLSASSETDAGTDAWNASGGGRVLGWSLGVGGSGSSSFSHSMSKLNSLKISFENIAEYFVDRAGWFEPDVFQHPEVVKLIKNNTRLINNLQYVALSMIIARGTLLELRFSEKINSADWSARSINASGGASFLGYSFNTTGSSLTTRSTIKASDDGLGVTFKDGSNVTRVLGVRVEPFLVGTTVVDARISSLAAADPELKEKFEAFKKGKASYLSLQTAKVNAITKALGAAQ